MEYRVIRHEQSDDYMEHGVIKNAAKKVYTSAVNRGGRVGRAAGWVKEGHDYLARMKIGDKWRYAYTQAQLAAMKGWGKGRQAAKVAVGDAKQKYRQAKNIVTGKYAEDVRKRESQGRDLMAKGNNARINSSPYKSGSSASDREAAEKMYKKGEYKVETAQKKKQGLAYKISDILGSGLESETLRPYVTKGKSLVKSVLNKATGAYDSAKNFGSTKLSEAKTYASKGKEFIQSLPDWSKTKAQNANAMVKEKTGVDVWDTAKRAGNKVKTEITEKPEHIKNLYEQTRSDAGDIVREGKRRAGEAATNAKNAIEKIPGVSKAISLAKSAKTTADNLSESIADFARSNYRYATDSDYRNLTKEVKIAQKQLSSVQSQIAELKAESAKLGPGVLPEGYNAIYDLQAQEQALTSQINRANSVLDKYDED